MRHLRDRLRGSLTYANVTVTLLAVLVVGGGGAYAAKHKIKLTLKPNSVHAKQVKNGAVTSGKLAPGAVDTRHIAAGAITKPKIPDASVSLSKLDGAVKARFLDPANVHRIDFGPGLCDAGNTTGCNADVVDFAGLTLHAACIENGVNNQERLTITATAADGNVNYVSQGGTGVGGPFAAAGAGFQAGFRGAPHVAAVAQTAANGRRREIGELVYHRDDGTVVDITVSLYATHTGADRRCELFGTAVVS